MITKGRFIMLEHNLLFRICNDYFWCEGKTALNRIGVGERSAPAV